LLAFQPSDLSDAVTDVKWSPHDANIFGSVTSDGRILLWDVKRIDPAIGHEVAPEFTKEEAEMIEKAETNLEKRRERKLRREKEAIDPLLMLAMSMKQQKGEATEEELAPVDTEEELAEAADAVEQLKNQYKKLTCIEFAPDAPVVVVGSADGTVCCLRIHGMSGGESYSTDEQRDRLEASLFVDEM
jgi:WD40 repeat protein